MSRVHVQVDAERASRGEHPVGQVFGGDAGAVEVAHEPFGRQADRAPGAVDLVRPSWRRTAPPDAPPRIVLAVLYERRQVLPERDEVTGRGARGRPRAETDRAVAQLRHRGGIGLGREILDAIRLHPVLAVLRLEAAVERRDDVRYHLRGAGDHARAVLARGADRLDGSGLD